MNQHVNAVKKEVTKDQLIAEFNAVVSDTEHLLRSVAAAGGEQAGTLRDSAEKKLAAAKDRLLRLQQVAAEKTGAMARATDEYAHEHPWQTIGVAAGIAAIAGVVLGIILNRR